MFDINNSAYKNCLIFLKAFKSEQRSCFACKEQSLRQIATCAGSVSSSGFQRGIMTPAETLIWNPPPIEAGGICDLGYNDELSRTYCS